MVSIEQLTRLSEARGEPRLSLYLPLRHDGTQHAKTRIRAKNLLRNAERALRSGATPVAEVDRLLEASERILDRVRRYPTEADGLALFAGPDGVWHFEVPLRLPELVVVGDRFVTFPLLPLLGADDRFFVLAFGQDEFSLYAGSRGRIEEVDLDGRALSAWQTMPKARPAEVLSFVADRGGIGGAAVFHGGGDSAADDRKALLRRHFRGVDRELRDIVGKPPAPLVLAAVRSVQWLYREVNSYPHLAEEGIDGSPREMSLEEMRRRAWSIVEALLARDAQAVVDRHQELKGTGRTVDRPADALAAAADGQVESLLIHADACSARPAAGIGVLRPTDDVVRPLVQIEEAAIATARQGGAVVVLPAGQLPQGVVVAATLRYPRAVAAPTSDASAAQGAPAPATRAASRRAPQRAS